jgi:tetratricopeptide (TPR) repeat protein
MLAPLLVEAGFSPSGHKRRLDVYLSSVAIAPFVLGLTIWMSASGGPDASAQTAPRPAPPPPSRPAAGATFEALSKRANAAREAGRLEEAIALYRDALRLKPEWGEGRWYLGTSYYELDRYAPAAAAFKRLIASEPKHGAAWGFRGLCEFQLRQYEPALVSLMKARELGLGANQELTSVVRYHTAILMTRFSQFEFAQKVLSEFTADGNDNSKILEALGLATLRVPQLPDEVDPGRREQLLLAGGGAFYYYSRMTAASNGQFQELIRRYPDVPNVHYAYGVVLLNEAPDRAVDEFKEELRRSPAHVPSMLQIAFEYIKRSDWTAARPWAEQAVKIESTSVPARQALGQALLELDDVNGAIEQLRAGIALSPESPILHFTLARAYRKAGRAEEAERERLEFQRLDRQRAGARDKGTLQAPAPAAVPEPAASPKP